MWVLVAYTPSFGSGERVGTLTVNINTSGHEDAWRADPKGGMKLEMWGYSLVKKSDVWKWLGDVKITGNTASINLEANGRYRISWNGWTQEFEYDGVNDPVLDVTYEGSSTPPKSWKTDDRLWHNQRPEELSPAAASQFDPTATYRATHHVDTAAAAMPASAPESKRMVDLKPIEDRKAEEAAEKARTEAAATKIQSAVRGKQAQKKLADLKSEAARKKAEEAARRTEEARAAAEAAEKARTEAAARQKAEDDARKAAEDKAREEAARKAMGAAAASSAPAGGAGGGEDAKRKLAQTREASKKAHEEARKAREAEARADLALRQAAENTRQKAENDAREAALREAEAAVAAGEVIQNSNSITLTIKDETGDDRLTRLLDAGHVYFAFRLKDRLILKKQIKNLEESFNAPNKACELSLEVEETRPYQLGIYDPSLPLKYKAIAADEKVDFLMFPDDD